MLRTKLAQFIRRVFSGRASHREREAAKLDRIRTQAAKWVAVLAGPNREAEMQRFDRWVHADPRSRAAFVSAAAVWRRTRRPANQPRQPIESYF
jgi:ferric-dicitrate binding protein FerR (iron transport regulator)